MTATLTSHTLNGTDGTHAGGIAVTVRDPATGATVLRGETDPGGRLSLTLPDGIAPGASCEVIFDTGAYWDARAMPATVRQIALRFAVPAPGGSLHMPVILNPNSYSMWSSA